MVSKLSAIDKNRTLDGVDIDDNGNLEVLPRLVLIEEECGNLKVVVGDGEFTRNINRNINKKKKQVALKAYRCLL